MRWQFGVARAPGVGRGRRAGHADRRGVSGHLAAADRVPAGGRPGGAAVGAAAVPAAPAPVGARRPPVVEVDALDAAGQRHLTFDEAVPREVDIAVDINALSDGSRITPVELPGGEEAEALADAAGSGGAHAPAGDGDRARVESRTARPVPAAAAARGRREHGRRTSPPTRPGRGAAPLPGRRAPAAGRARRRFLSLLDPPAWAAAAAAACDNLHTFPVLAGEDGGGDASCSPRRSSSTTTPGSRRRAPATCSTRPRSTRSSRCAR